MNIKERYITPLCRVVNIGGEGSVCEPEIGIGSKFEGDMTVDVREQDDDLWNEPNTEWEKPSGVWDNAW